MTSPCYTDRDLHRLLYQSRTLDLDVDAVEPGDCACRLEAMRTARAQGRVQYGQCWPEGDVECESPYTFGAGLIALSCSNADRVVDCLNAEGYDGDDLDDELVRRIVRAAVKEALRRPNQETRDEQPASPEESLCFALARSIDLVTAGHPIQEVNRAGRALRGGTTS